MHIKPYHASPAAEVQPLARALLQRLSRTKQGQNSTICLSLTSSVTRGQFISKDARFAHVSSTVQRTIVAQLQ